MNRSKEKQIVFLDCDVQDKIWVVARNIPGIFTIDKELSMVNLKYILNKKIEQHIKGLTVKIAQKYIYVFFEQGVYVYRIDKKSGRIETINIEKKYIQLEGVHEYRGKYYMIPSKSGDPLLEFNGSIIKECIEWKERIKKIAIFKHYYFTIGFGAENNYIWTFVPYTNYLVQTDLNDYSLRYWRIGKNYRFETIGLQGNLVWLISKEPNVIICWSVEDGIKKEYTEFPLQLEWGEKFSFIKIIACKNKVFFIPGQASNVMVLDLQSNEFGIIGVTMTEDIKKDNDKRKFFSSKIIDNKLYLFGYCVEDSVIIDIDNYKVVKTEKLSINKEDFMIIQKEILNTTGYLHENSDVKLKDYFKIL